MNADTTSLFSSGNTYADQGENENRKRSGRPRVFGQLKRRSICATQFHLVDIARELRSRHTVYNFGPLGKIIQFHR